MNFNRYYVVFLRKGPVWSPELPPEHEGLQERHLAHLAGMAEQGLLLAAGPTSEPTEGDLRGISVLPFDGFDSLEDVRALVEADPAILAGRLQAEYATWFTTASIAKSEG